MEDFNFKDISEMLAGFAKKMEKLRNMTMSDRISAPLGWYHIQTGPDLLSDNPNAYITILAVESYDHEHNSDPCGVEVYNSREEAVRGHDYWRRACMDSPMRIMKDVVTGEIITVDF